MLKTPAVFKMQTISKVVSHKNRVNNFNNGCLPPIFNAKIKNGRLILSVAQQDEDASRVKIYGRAINGTQKSAYKEITTINITKRDGVKLINMINVFSVTSILRAIPIKNKRLQYSFVDRVISPVNKVKDPPEFSTITSTVNKNGNVTLKVRNLSQNYLKCQFVRKNLTLRDKTFTRLGIPFSPSVSLKTFTDSKLNIGQTYEYRCLFLKRDSIEKVSIDSDIIKYNIPAKDIPFSVSQRKLSSPGQNGTYSIGFKLSVTEAPSQSKMLMSALRAMNISQYFNTTSLGDFIEELIFFKVTRKNLSTGKVNDLGITYPGAFIDKGSARAGILPPVITSPYRYQVEMFVRDAAQAFSETQGIQSSQSQLAIQKNRVATVPKAKGKYAVNNQSKFFAPLALQDSTLSTGRSLVLNHAGKTIEIGNTGVKQEILLSGKGYHITKNYIWHCKLN